MKNFLNNIFHLLFVPYFDFVIIKKEKGQQIN
jgi:hypothetical protein